MSASSSATDTSVLLEFMYRLGQAYLACGEQTAKVELVLRRVASAYGARRSRVVIFPTAVFISIHEGENERVTLAEGPIEAFRLDQIAAVYELGAAAQAGSMTPAQGLERLGAIRRTRAQLGKLGVVCGHALLAAGVSIILAPSLNNLIAAVVLGVIVGGLKIVDRNSPLFAAPMPVVAALLVSSLVFLSVRNGLPVHPLHALVPPLVTFLPGAMLTLGMVELAYGDMVSGTSRLVTGFVQLVLLAFGLVGGAVLIGYNPENLLDTTEQLTLRDWVPWVGVLVFGFGASLHFSAPRKSLAWMLLVLVLTFAAQQIAAASFGTAFSGFFGMLVGTPLSYLIHLRFKGPPAMVTFLPSFWLLVPGALGLISIKQMLSDRDAGVDGLTSLVFVFTSIALGTLMGASLYKWLTETLGYWQLQIGRVGSYLRANRRK